MKFLLMALAVCCGCATEDWQSPVAADDPLIGVWRTETSTAGKQVFVEFGADGGFDYLTDEGPPAHGTWIRRQDGGIDCTPSCGTIYPWLAGDRMAMQGSYWTYGWTVSASGRCAGPGNSTDALSASYRLSSDQTVTGDDAWCADPFVGHGPCSGTWTADAAGIQVTSSCRSLRSYYLLLDNFLTDTILSR